MNTTEDLVRYESLVIWKKVAEYLTKNPSAMPVRISIDCNCTERLAAKFRDDWNKHHRDAVLKSKATNFY